MNVISEQEFLAKLQKYRGKRPLTAVAPELNVTFQFLSKVLAGEYGPGVKLAHALGYEPVTCYRRRKRK